MRIYTRNTKKQKNRGKLVLLKVAILIEFQVHYLVFRYIKFSGPMSATKNIMRINIVKKINKQPIS